MTKLMTPAIELVPVASLKTDDDFAKALPAPDNLPAIRRDIKHHGILVPLLTSSDDLVLDGHTRLKLAKELGLETVPVIRVPVGAERTWLHTIQIALNLHRRHLNELQRVALGTSLEKLEREKAKARHKEGSSRGGKHPKQGQANGEPTLARKSKKIRRATEKAAEQVGLSRVTYERGKAILERAPEEIRTNALSGELSISAAHRRLRQHEQAESVKFLTPLNRPSNDFSEFTEIPEKHYLCIYIQTPKPDRFSGTIEEELAAIDVPSLMHERGCHLWLWASWRMLRDGVVERILGKWNFNWVAEVVWHKGVPGPGRWIKPSTEVCVFATQGPLDILLDNQTGFLDVKCKEEGDRPEEMRAFIERCSSGPRLEIFARTSAPGWDAFTPERKKKTEEEKEPKAEEEKRGTDW
jgi:N6-adenosine-specific RNA methylase IME4/ParB-like chromosome segregation protein Spo0J